MSRTDQPDPATAAPPPNHVQVQLADRAIPLTTLRAHPERYTAMFLRAKAQDGHAFDDSPVDPADDPRHSGADSRSRENLAGPVCAPEIAGTAGPSALSLGAGTAVDLAGRDAGRSWDTCHRRLVEAAAPSIARVATLLMVLYAQPLTKVLRLTIDNVLRNDDEVTIQLGDLPTPVPEPFASILVDYVANRRNLTTGNADARWFFPSVNPGQPMTGAGARKHLRRHGLPTLGGRSAALQQLLLDAPPPVIAGMLGFTNHHLARVAGQIGITWSRYAAGDHTRL